MKNKYYFINKFDTNNIDNQNKDTIIIYRDYTANKISEKQALKLISSIKKTLQKAIDLGGSSISDYVNATGEFGGYQSNFRVYGRENEKCFNCNDSIKRIVQNGRSTFFCPKCQK